MSECEHASRLGAYHDGELPEAWAADVERHVSGCPACAAELDRLRALSRMCGSAAKPQMSPAAIERLQMKMEGLPGLGLRRMAEAVAACAASILVICTAAMGVFFTGREPVQAASQWEVTAVSGQGAETSGASAEDQIASWLVQDLSGKGGHE